MNTKRPYSRLEQIQRPIELEKRMRLVLGEYYIALYPRSEFFDPTKIAKSMERMKNNFSFILTEDDYAYICGEYLNCKYNINIDVYNTFQTDSEISANLLLKLREFISSKYSFPQINDNRLKIYPRRTKKILSKNLINSILEKNKHRHMSLKRIKELYLQTNNTEEFSLETLRKYMRKYMNLTYKKVICKPVRAISESNNYIQIVFLRKIIDILREGAHFIFVDETSFNTNHFAHKTWIPNNDNNPKPYSGKVKSVNLIAACDRHRMVHHQVFEGSSNSIFFSNFLKNLKDNLNKDTYYRRLLDRNRIWLIMDNSSIHKSALIKEQIKKIKLQLLFIPPYCPDMNMIELVFAYMKNQYYQEVFKSRYILLCI